MKTAMIPGCCGLKTIYQIGSLGKVDAYSKKDAEPFDVLVNDGKAQDGNWASYGKALDTIAIITTSNRYHADDPNQLEFKHQKAFFEKKGWKLLATWKSYESNGTNYMYGNPGMKTGKEIKD